MRDGSWTPTFLQGAGRTGVWIVMPDLHLNQVREVGCRRQVKAGRQKEHHISQNKPADPSRNTTSELIEVCSSSVIEQVIDLLLLFATPWMNTGGTAECRSEERRVGKEC